MQILMSLSAIIFGRAVVRKAVAAALSDNARKMTCHGLNIYCPKKKKSIVRNAVNVVAELYGESWESRCQHIKTIVIGKGATSCLLIPQRTLVINASDKSRMASEVDLAGWLIADYERIHVLENYSCRLISWSRTVTELASKSGLAKRKDYLATRDLSTDLH